MALVQRGLQSMAQVGLGAADESKPKENSFGLLYRTWGVCVLHVRGVMMYTCCMHDAHDACIWLYTHDACILLHVCCMHDAA